jgi:hypothetical protein
MCPITAPPPGAPLTRKKLSNRDDAHAAPTPSAPGQTTAALEAPAGRLRTPLRGPGRPGGLGHPVASPGPSATASTGSCPAHHHRRAGTHVSDHQDHQHDHGADHRVLPINRQPGHQAVRCQPADHHGRTICHTRRATSEQHDRHQHPLQSWGQDPAPRDHPEHHDRANHHRADHHGVVGDFCRQPASRRLGRAGRGGPGPAGSGLPASPAPPAARQDARQAAAPQPPPPRMSRKNGAVVAVGGQVRRWLMAQE